MKKKTFVSKVAQAELFFKVLFYFIFMSLFVFDEKFGVEALKCDFAGTPCQSEVSPVNCFELNWCIIQTK